MTLIEKEPIMEFIQEGLNKKHYGHVGVEIITEVEFAPTIDAVPVVRCKDCIHRHESEFCECRDDDAFCSDGERNPPEKV